jgi:uncharacterized protein (DUF58 family)
MRPTERFWWFAGLGAVLAALSVAADRPIALVGAAGVAAWLVTAQFRAVDRLGAIDDRVAVTYEPVQPATGVDRPLTVRLDARLDEPVSVPVTVRAPLPVAADGPGERARTVSLDPGETHERLSVSISFPTAGSYRLPQPTVAASDDWGLLTAEVERGDRASVSVQSRSPGDIHVGRGGQTVGEEFGDHRTDRRGEAGLVPTGLRTYLPDDPADRIDWRATARLGEPYVREFETETGRRTLVVVDARERMGVGETGRTMLDHAREVALGVLGTAEASGDAIGAYAVGDEGLTLRTEQASTPAHYASVRVALDRVEATRGATGAPDDGPVASPTRARRLLDRLSGDEPLGAVRPYLSSVDAYVRRVEGDPLFRTVQLANADARGQSWTVLITDDADRESVYEAARQATEGDDHALVFLTPRVLYEPGAMADVEAADERYRSFESFRRDLEGLPRVTAFEVAPGDRLDALVTARRARRST